MIFHTIFARFSQKVHFTQKFIYYNKNIRYIFIVRIILRMNKEDKIHAEKVLKNLFVGAQVVGLQFCISPVTIKIHFTNFEDAVDYSGQLYVNIESKWGLFNNPPKRYPSNEDEFEDYSEDEENEKIFEMRRQKVTDIQLGIENPHLIITLESGQIFL